jgi:hypothetical protein
MTTVKWLIIFQAAEIGGQEPAFLLFQNRGGTGS